jgi:hypothetical protein
VALEEDTSTDGVIENVGELEELIVAEIAALGDSEPKLLGEAEGDHSERVIDSVVL